MLAILDEAGRKFNANEADGVSRRHSQQWPPRRARDGGLKDAGRFVARPGKRIDGRTRKTTAADGTRRGARGRQHHGLSLLRRAVEQLGARPLDQALDPESPSAARSLSGGAT
jgi:hypothetical protein